MDFDDNVPLVPEGLDYPGDEEGLRFGTYLTSAYRFVQTEDWQAGIGFNFIQTVYDRHDVDDYNLTTINPRAFVGHLFNVRMMPAYASASYDYRRDWLGYGGYESSHVARVDLVTKPLHWLETNLFYSASFEDYDIDGERPSLTSRDTTEHTVGLSADIFLNHQRDCWLTLGYAYVNSDARGSNFDSDAHSIQTGLTTRVSGPLWFMCEVSYATSDYASYTFSPQRLQDVWNFRAVLLYQIDKHWSADLSYLHTRSDATSDEFEYQRNVIGVGVTWRY